MKYLLILLCSLLSCQNAAVKKMLNIKKGESNQLNTIKNDSLFTGIPLLSNRIIINQIDSTCKIDSGKYTNDNCVLYGINFDEYFDYFKEEYSKLKINEEIVRGMNFQNYHFILKRIPIPIENIDNPTIQTSTSLKVILYTYTLDDIKIDSIPIFEYYDQIDFAYQIQNCFYINKNNLWILSLYVGESGTSVRFYKKYTINSEGKLILENSKQNENLLK